MAKVVNDACMLMCFCIFFVSIFIAIPTYVMACDGTLAPKCVGAYNVYGYVGSYDAKDDGSGPPIFYTGIATYKLMDGGTCVVQATTQSKHDYGDALKDIIAQNPSSRNITLYQPRINQKPPYCYTTSRGRDLAIVGLTFFAIAGISLSMILFGCGCCIQEQYCRHHSTYEPPSAASNTATDTEMVNTQI